LLKLADLMERDQEKLAAVESLNGGKGIRVAK
jgi:aldehyde dehydrogenase (NAD+)